MTEFETINEDKDFEKWYNERLIVTRFPTPQECLRGKAKDFEVFINVSDEHYLEYNFELAKAGKVVFWFPMGEMSTDLGMSSIFGALQIVYLSFRQNKKVVIHCHAGANRSQVIRDCIHFMITGKHSVRKTLDLKINGLETDPRQDKMNMLQWNCDIGHLSSIEIMEEWLKQLKIAFDEPHRFLGGMYDWSLRQINLYVKKREFSIEDVKKAIFTQDENSGK